MLTIQQAFETFLQSLELTKKDSTAASDQHTYMRTELQKRLSVEDNFLSGSYARHTAVRPLNDIDIFLVLDKRQYTNLDPQATLKLVQTTLQGIYSGKTTTRQLRSINIEFTGTGISYDVVPAFSVGPDVYRIPDASARAWIETNPKKHQELSTRHNERAGKKLKPLFKAVKHAKKVHKAPARSFHLEVLSWSIFPSPPQTYIEGLDQLFSGLAARANAPCPDPAGLGPDIRPSQDDLWGTKLWLDQMAKLAREARQLAAGGKLADAHAKLRSIFGPEWREHPLAS